MLLSAKESESKRLDSSILHAASAECTVLKNMAFMDSATISLADS